MRYKSLLIIFTILICAVLFWKSFDPLRELSQAPYKYSYPFDAVANVDPEIDLERARIDISAAPTQVQLELAQKLVVHGRKFWNDEDVKSGQRIADKYLKQNPANLKATLILADAHQYFHEFEAAENLLNKCAGCLQTPEGLSMAAKIALATNNFTQATKYSDELIARLPLSGSFAIRAQILEAQEKRAEAELAYRKAFAVEDIGDVWGSAFLRGIFARFLFKQERVHEARIMIDEATRLDPTSRYLKQIKETIAGK